MSTMPESNPSQGLAPSLNDNSAQASMHEMQATLHNDRGADYYEAQSIKWNVARIVRLSSGRFALLSPFNEGAIDLIKVGTIEEIIGDIPTYDQCVSYCEKRPSPHGLEALLADIGL